MRADAKVVQGVGLVPGGHLDELGVYPAGPNSRLLAARDVHRRDAAAFGYRPSLGARPVLIWLGL